MLKTMQTCVFSAKELLPGETNVAYICSRYYRAPELILGATDYTIQIGLFCVLSVTAVINWILLQLS